MKKRFAAVLLVGIGVLGFYVVSQSGKQSPNSDDPLNPSAVGLSAGSADGVRATGRNRSSAGAQETGAAARSRLTVACTVIAPLHQSRRT